MFLEQAQDTIHSSSTYTANELVSQGREACRALQAEGGGRMVAMNLMEMNGYKDAGPGIIAAAHGTLC